MGRVSFVAISEAMEARAGAKDPRLGAKSTAGKRDDCKSTGCGEEEAAQA